MTNIVEQITYYGEPKPPIGPHFGVIDAGTAGELVAEGLSQGRFLILTTEEAKAELKMHGDDIEAYLERIVEHYT